MNMPEKLIIWRPVQSCKLLNILNVLSSLRWTFSFIFEHLQNGLYCIITDGGCDVVVTHYIFLHILRKSYRIFHCRKISEITVGYTHKNVVVLILWVTQMMMCEKTWKLMTMLKMTQKTEILNLNKLWICLNQLFFMCAKKW